MPVPHPFDPFAAPLVGRITHELLHSDSARLRFEREDGSAATIVLPRCQALDALLADNASQGRPLLRLRAVSSWHEDPNDLSLWRLWRNQMPARVVLQILTENHYVLGSVTLPTRRWRAEPDGGNLPLFERVLPSAFLWHMLTTRDPAVTPGQRALGLALPFGLALWTLAWPVLGASGLLLKHFGAAVVIGFWLTWGIAVALFLKGALSV